MGRRKKKKAAAKQQIPRASETDEWISSLSGQTSPKDDPPVDLGKDFSRLDLEKPSIVHDESVMLENGRIAERHKWVDSVIGAPGDERTTLHKLSDGAVDSEDDLRKFKRRNKSPRINMRKERNTGQTALFLAACNGHIQVCEQLIMAGANIDQPDNKGETPFHAAMSNRKLDCAAYLFKMGARASCSDPKCLRCKLHFKHILKYMKKKAEDISENQQVVENAPEPDSGPNSGETAIELLLEAEENAKTQAKKVSEIEIEEEPVSSLSFEDMLQSCKDDFVDKFGTYHNLGGSGSNSKS